MSDRDADQEQTDAIRELENEFGVLVHRYRQVIGELANRVSEGMLPGAYKVFTTIVRHEPVTASALAEELMADKGQISRTVRELEDLRLIHRTPDPADRRSWLLSATPEGLARLEAARAGYGGVMAATLTGWEVSDIRHLTRLLHALSEGGASQGS